MGGIAAGVGGEARRPSGEVSPLYRGDRRSGAGDEDWRPDPLLTRDLPGSWAGLLEPVHPGEEPSEQRAAADAAPFRVAGRHACRLQAADEGRPRGLYRRRGLDPGDLLQPDGGERRGRLVQAPDRPRVLNDEAPHGGGVCAALRLRYHGGLVAGSVGVSWRPDARAKALSEIRELAVVAGMQDELPFQHRERRVLGNRRRPTRAQIPWPGFFAGAPQTPAHVDFGAGGPQGRVKELCCAGPPQRGEGARVWDTP